MYSFYSFTGDETYKFLAVLDGHYPLDVDERGDAVVIMHGPDRPGRPTFDDVAEAPIEEWIDLLDKPWDASRV